LRVLAYDTESTDLSASWGRILCCSFCVITDDSPAYTFRSDRAKWRGEHIVDDSKLVVAIRDELEKADIIVSWNGILHDIPLLNARLAYAGERGVHLGEKFGTWHLDAMYYSGGQSMKVGGRRLDTIAKFFGVKNQKTPLDGVTWQKAAAGDKNAMNDIVIHCEQDVLVLRDLWEFLAPHVKKFTFTLSEVYPFIGEIPSRTRS